MANDNDDTEEVKKLKDWLIELQQPYFHDENYWYDALGNMDANPDSDECKHKYKQYKGLTETYDYCEYCDVKRSND